MNAGNFVMFKNPNPDELGLIFSVLELRGDRVLVSADVDMVVNPTMVYQVADLEVVQ